MRQNARDCCTSRRQHRSCTAVRDLSVATHEETGSGIHIVLDTGSVGIHPKLDEVYVEVAELRGFADGAWMVWRPGEESFEDLAS